MKKTYFLDKIYNANHYEFNDIVKKIIDDEVGFKDFEYTCFKKKEKWVIDIETGEDLITILFDDYTMYVHSKFRNITGDNTNYWRNTFNKFLRKKQKLQYAKNIEQETKDNEDALKLNKDEVKSYVNF